jgi:hypothetical protein
MIDLHILPRKAQNELIDFYQFLVERYVSEKKKRQSPNNAIAKQDSSFFDQYNIDLSDFNFNRSELYDR